MSRWRADPTGVIYQQAGGDPLADGEESIGVMYYPEHAEMAAGMHNEYVDALRRLVGLLHTSAIPESWRRTAGPNASHVLYLTDVVDRLCEMYEPNSLRAPEGT